ncbi:hypothetical protein T10_1816 [Trichinella papuae]|uniref:Uncharacterized protein n=1 Tax=Trichinella papuae TaxID=268474 RepID=A0A0V1MVJ8_9BILA|nr:hypothetical protein T10_1816 [Trichinella papuae]
MSVNAPGHYGADSDGLFDQQYTLTSTLYSCLLCIVQVNWTVPLMSPMLTNYQKTTKDQGNGRFDQWPKNL